MLWSGPDRELPQISSAANEAPRRRTTRAPKSEQGLKRGHRGLPPIVPKHELVKIDLQMVTADAVVRADEPLLQVADGAVGERHDRGHAAAQGAPDGLCTGDVPDAGGLQAFPSFESVGVDGCPRRDVVSDEVEHRGLREIRRDYQPHAARAIGSFLHRDQHDHRFASFQLATPAQAGLGSANPGIVDLHVAVQRLAGRVDHGATEFVQEQPRGLVPANAQLPLQEQRGDAALVRGHQVRRPKPDRQRGLGPMEHRARRQRDLVPTLRAFAPMPLAEGIRSPTLAARTSKPVGPSTRLQVLPAGRFVSELLLELPEAGRERRAGHGGTLLIVAS